MIRSRCKDGLIHDDYIQYFEDVHAPSVDDLPGLQQYQIAICPLWEGGRFVW